MFMELYREEKREEGDRGGQEDKGVEIKRRDTDPASNQFLSVLHHLEHTKRFTELGREEKWEGGNRGTLVEKKESPKGEREIRPVTRSLSVLHRLEHTEIRKVG